MRGWDHLHLQVKSAIKQISWVKPTGCQFAGYEAFSFLTGNLPPQNFSGEHLCKCKTKQYWITTDSRIAQPRHVPLLDPCWGESNIPVLTEVAKCGLVGLDTVHGCPWHRYVKMAAPGSTKYLLEPIHFTVLDASRYGFGGERLAKAVREICTAVAASRLSPNQWQKHLGKGGWERSDHWYNLGSVWCQ